MPSAENVGRVWIGVAATSTVSAGVDWAVPISQAASPATDKAIAAPYSADLKFNILPILASNLIIIHRAVHSAYRQALPQRETVTKRTDFSFLDRNMADLQQSLHVPSHEQLENSRLPHNVDRRDCPKMLSSRVPSGTGTDIQGARPCDIAY